MPQTRDVTRAPRAETNPMATVGVECLRCGMHHRLVQGDGRALQQGECPRCGYVGWATARELDEHLRRTLRDHPVERRRLRFVA